MAQKERPKDYWLIPKRGNLHQTICLIDGIVESNYDTSTWNEHKQNRLATYLSNFGATKNGKSIHNQSIRTLLASIPQYLAFVYINNDKTPSTVCITKAGYKLLEAHKNQIVKIRKLSSKQTNLISESPVVLKQMEKLQITNPIILKDCENIFIFPFRFTLKLLINLEYLDREEMAYFLFKTKDESELALKIEEIKMFRNLSKENRKTIIDNFKKTHLGNISLVQASSASYYEKICKTTGLIETFQTVPSNSNKKISCIKIKSNCVEDAKNLLKKYEDIPVFDFKNNLDLWINYMGNPERFFPPTAVTITNCSEINLFLQIFDTNKNIQGMDVVNSKESISLPLFVNENYTIISSSLENANVLNEKNIIPSYSKNNFNLQFSNLSSYKKEENFPNLSEEIILHSTSRNFSPSVLKYLDILKKLTGDDYTQNKSLRGAYYEYLFFKLLSLLKNKKIIDDVYWNGKIGKFQLPSPAPGGKTGNPDIVFRINNYDFVLELTAIKSKSQQFSAEAASVPDHIRLYRNSTTKNKKVLGIFCAPEIHRRNTAAMQSILKSENIPILCIDDRTLIKILNARSKSDLLSKFIDTVDM
ncbi:AlwI family type II restriction endonuclease [[Mycoplasma] testudinis]|uniref:AlwI family type II restriction endonuclease n=1 Tax=[Mycoplasma] testudinis TaxID=33924 RepID=UPI0004879599|nr:AlwI family type II restriction endonuclease [[Mycoplasma] testudinis]